MKNEKFEEALNEEMDNLLSVKDKEELAEYLKHNRAARNAAWWYGRMKDGFSQQDEIELPANFTASVMSKIDALPVWQVEVNETTQVKPRTLWKWGVAFAAGIAGLIFIGSPKDKDVVVAVRPTVVQEFHPEGTTSGRDWIKADLKLVSVQGEAQVLKQDGYTWQKLSGTVRLNYNDRVRTLAGSNVHLAYDDGTELKLKPESMIEVMSNGIRVFHGSSWISVVKKGRHFEARTPNLVASVRGTAYDVTVSYPNKPLELALADLSQRKELLIKSVSPEVYFRDFTLDALAELSARDSDFSVDSRVRVYESSVFVAPADALGQEEERGLVLSEGQMVEVRPDNWHLQLAAKPMGDNDYTDWGLSPRIKAQPAPAPVERKGTGLVTPEVNPANPSNQTNSTGVKEAGVEISPAESFEQLGN